MKRMTRDIILATISELVLYYPSANIGPKQIDQMADLWFEDLEDKDAEKFSQAVKNTRTEGGRKFFPSLSEILENYNHIQNRIPESRQIEHKVERIGLKEMKRIRKKNMGHIKKERISNGDPWWIRDAKKYGEVPF